ncbi:MAG: hypothetical protein E7656_00545 [Ruminococcaceae bacterium]|nr:hypothetical protein [Oscillospiraceae bacterium]
MNEKKLFISQLYDYYGELLTEKQQYAVEMYYNDDLSLSEIAESIGITRQGVRDQLKHAEEFLVSCEEKLGLADKIQKVLLISEQIQELCSDESAKLLEISEMSSKITDLLS